MMLTVHKRYIKGDVLQGVVHEIKPVNFKLYLTCSDRVAFKNIFDHC